jgi:hypothetical protein
MQLCKQNHPKKSTAISVHFQVWYGHEMFPPSFPVEIPRKLKEKSRQKTTPYRDFCSIGYLFQSGYMESCLPHKKVFFFLKGRVL